MSTFIIISVGLFLISLVVLTSCFGIYFSRKYKFIGNISSKRNTLVLLIILNLFVVFAEFQQTQNLFFSITSAMGFVLGFPFTMGYVGIFIMKRVLKNNSITNKDYWSSSFFSLIWVSILIFKK
jgi:UPF0716 family protein affecting phage T7 exclusion